jgi:hypothetical protein
MATITLTLITGAQLTITPDSSTDAGADGLGRLLAQPGGVIEGRTTHDTPVLVPVRSVLYAEPAAPDDDDFN